MTRISLALDALPKLKNRAVSVINDEFNRRAIQELHRDAAHMRKRSMAEAVMAGANLPDDHPFTVEAAQRAMTPLNFAEVVLSKIDSVQAREIERQMLLLRIDIAPAPAIITGILSEAGLTF